MERYIATVSIREGGSHVLFSLRWRFVCPRRPLLSDTRIDFCLWST